MRTCARPQDLSDVWLADHSFVGGDDICIADLSICSELQMLELMDGSLQVSICKPVEHAQCLAYPALALVAVLTTSGLHEPCDGPCYHCLRTAASYHCCLLARLLAGPLQAGASAASPHGSSMDEAGRRPDSASL